MKIDPEFKSFIPPLSTDERRALEASIVKAGRATDPLVMWIEESTIIDGHNRFEICTEHGLPFDVRGMSFADRDAVKAWMFEHQIARRNLSIDQLVALAAARGIKTDKGTARQRSMAADLATSPDDCAAVISGRRSLAIAWGSWGRRTGKIASKPYAPRTTPARTVEVITAETRAKAEAAAAKADVKAVASRLVQLEAELAFMHAAPCAPPVIATPKSRPKSGKRIATPCFVLSDLHFGETVTLEETLGANEYNLDIAAARTSKCFDNMLWLRDDMARTQTCDDTVLFLNGDIVSGDIHDELRETNDGGLRDQCDAAFRALHPGIKAFADATPGVLHVVCIGGNHGRLTHKQQIKNGQQHSAEHIGVYDPLRRVIGDMGGKVAWHIPPAERYIVDIHGHRVSAQHGTMIRSAGGIGGVLVPMVRWVTRDNSADYYVFGHFHEADAFGKIIKNGATIGSSAYTRWLGIEDRPPEQVGFVLDAVRGLRRFERVSVS